MTRLSFQNTNDPSQKKKCGNCIFFRVRPPEVELAKHALHVGECAPGVHCMGGQVRGTCDKWAERMEMGLPMPWGDQAMVESTFVCRLWQAGGPSVKLANGGFNRYNTKRGKKAAALYIAGVFVGWFAGKGK